MTVAEVKLDVLEGIKLFLTDPPDSEYQEGYLAALLSVAEMLGLNNRAPVQEAHAVLERIIGCPVIH